jgi:endo-1,4-beta-D-glucanase Y
MLGRRSRLALAAAAAGALALSAAAASGSPAGAVASTNRPFPHHVTYQLGVMPSASQSTRDGAVRKQYDSWKSHYLRAACGGYLVYATGDAPNKGTVSEAQGYGMNIVPLMAGYDADAKAEFDGLWKVVRDHRDAKGMMQWILDGKSCRYADSGTPDAATDGDLDIGYGLLLADRQWGGYSADAHAWLAALYAADVASSGYLKAEDDEDSSADNGSRPSDWMLDHLRAFAAYDPAHDWARVITKTEHLITEMTAGYSPTAGLLPDFVVKANTSSPKPAPADYQESQPDNIVGYNSVRVPWHLGTDALLYGGTVSAATASKQSASYRSHANGSAAKIYPHTKLDGTPTNKDDQCECANDPVGVAAMAAGDQVWTDRLWGFLATNPYGDTYYGETIKMLVYLVMAGDYWSPVA